MDEFVLVPVRFLELDPATGKPRATCWRPLRVGETPIADPQAPSSPVCYIATPDPRDYVPYWRRTRLS